MTFRSDRGDITRALSLESSAVSRSGGGLGGKSLSLLKAKLKIGAVRVIIPCSSPDGLVRFLRDDAGRTRRVQTGSEKEYDCFSEV